MTDRLITEWSAYLAAALVAYVGCKWLLSIGVGLIVAVYQ